jgi:lipopolysaccharide biosynthesis glycosyltransferase
VERAVYMDVDTVVQGDAVKLFETPLQPGRYFAAVSNCYLHMSYWFDFDVPVVKRTFHPRDCYINAGVYVVDLVQYKARCRRAPNTLTALLVRALCGPQWWVRSLATELRVDAQCSIV